MAKEDAYRYLFIDDDEISNFLAESIVEKMGVLEVSAFFDDAPEALNYLRNKEKKGKKELPDYIFLDLNMPRMGGFEFLEVFEEQKLDGDHTQIFILSSSVSPSDIDRSKNYRSVKGFISKPLKTEDLRKILNPSQIK
jgi:CheY-like chemotaxis protein